MMMRIAFSVSGQHHCGCRSKEDDREYVDLFVIIPLVHFNKE